MNRVRVLAALSWLYITLACDTEARHGSALRVGATLSVQRVWCGTSSHDAIGLRGKIQIVTFASETDCWNYRPHLEVVGATARTLGPSVESVLVVWTMQRAASPRFAKSLRNLGYSKICLDIDNSLWNEYQLETTPVSVVLQHGQIEYVLRQPIGVRHELSKFAELIDSLEIDTPRVTR